MADLRDRRLDRSEENRDAIQTVFVDQSCRRQLGRKGKATDAIRALARQRRQLRNCVSKAYPAGHEPRPLLALMWPAAPMFTRRLPQAAAQLCA